jgi:hypothetical protein
MIIKEEETLNEIMGTFVRPQAAAGANRYNNNTDYVDPTKGSDPGLIIRGIKLRRCNELEGWQRNIFNELTDGRDQYIIARPGGGKTMPIICYWADKLLGLNVTSSRVHVSPRQQMDIIKNLINLLINPKSIPKIMIMVPVISLAQQTAKELRGDLASIIMQLYNSNPSTILHGLSQTEPRIKSLYVRRLQLMKNKQPGREDVIDRNLNAVNRSLVDEVSKFIAKLVNKRIFWRVGSEKSRTNADEAIAFVTIYESASTLFKKDIRNKNINLQLLVFDESHLIQESGINIEDQERAHQISDSVYDVMKNKNIDRDCRIVMLTGTVNKNTAGELTNYMNKCFRRNFPKEAVEAPDSAANRSNLTIIRNESIKTTEGVVNSIIRSVHQNDWGQLYVLFSTKIIASIIELCIDKINIRNVENSERHGYEPSSTFSGLGKRRGRVSIKLTDEEILSIPPDMRMSVSNITNPILRQSVLRGVGFLHRKVAGDYFSGDQLYKMNEKDKSIVAKLFKDRKINVLLATDAVGIGVNIDVKDLYIPSIGKFNPNVGDHAPSSLRDLAQILNRAGRGATPIASIQTPKEDIDVITNALSANPEDFPEVGVNKSFSKCSKSKFYNICQKTLSIFRP